MEAPGWLVERTLRSNGFQLELRRYAWPKPNEFILTAERSVLGLVLESEPYSGRSRPLLSGHPGTFSPFGRLSFTPAAMPFEVHGSGGNALLMAFEIPQHVLDRLLPGADWEYASLSACSDIRNTRIDGLLERMLPELCEPGFGSDVMLEAIGMMTTAELARFLLKPRGGLGHMPCTPARRLSQHELDRISSLIENDNTTSLEAIAGQCGFSVRTLTRNFKATTGLTITSYIAERRMIRARQLLARTSKPLKVIAWETGFATTSSFTTAFRRETGFTPGEYRNRHS